MTRDEWFHPKFRLLRKFALASLAGALLLALAMYFNTPALAAVGAITIVPLIFWVAYIPVLHWRERYIGTRIGVWGAFLVFETSSWSKLIYWFRHVLPDFRKQGRYLNSP